MRILFPYITFLGALYKGNDGTNNAITFMEDYMSINDASYKDLAGLLYVGYRHGLMHTHMPKTFRYRNRSVGWWITYRPEAHFSFLNNNLLICPAVFYKDLDLAIKFYIKDFDDRKKVRILSKNFKKGFEEMGRITSLDKLGKKGSKMTVKSVRKGLMYLNQWSSPRIPNLRP